MQAGFPLEENGNGGIRGHGMLSADRLRNLYMRENFCSKPNILGFNLRIIRTLKAGADVVAVNNQQKPGQVANLREVILATF